MKLTGVAKRISPYSGVALSLVLHAVVLVGAFYTPAKFSTDMPFSNKATILTLVQSSSGPKGKAPAIYAAPSQTKASQKKKQSEAAPKLEEKITKSTPAPIKPTVKPEPEILSKSEPVLKPEPKVAESSTVPSREGDQDEKRAETTPQETSTAKGSSSEAYNGNGTSSNSDSRGNGLTQGPAYGGNSNSGDVFGITPLPNLKIIQNKKPNYPEFARLKRFQGTVVYLVKILRDGRPGESKLVASSGYQVLDKSAKDAIQHWRFEPATRLGVPVETWVEIPFTFAIKS